MLLHPAVRARPPAAVHRPPAAEGRDNPVASTWHERRRHQQKQQEHEQQHAAAALGALTAALAVLHAGPSHAAQLQHLPHLTTDLAGERWLQPAQEQQQQQQASPLLPFAPALEAAPAPGDGGGGGSSGPTAADAAGGLPPVYSRLPPLPQPGSFPELPVLRQPQIRRETLANGLRVFLLEDHEVPITRGSLLMLGGQASSPPDKVGLASIAAAVQRTGGSRVHPAEAMDERLEDLAAAIEASAGQQSISVDLECSSLGGDAREVLGLLAELLQQPALPQDKLELVQAQASNAIRHRDDSAAGVARRELYKLVYGQDSIYARTPTLTSVASLTPGDLATHVAAWERPDAALLGLVGDFDSGEMLGVIRETLGAWAPAPGQPPSPPQRPREQLADLPAVLSAEAAAPAPGAAATEAAAAAAAAAAAVHQELPGVVYLVDRPGAGQASVYMGEPGVSLLDPDTYALDVLSSRLNGFGGLLFDDLRTRQGLAYSVAASWDSPADHRGLFVAAAETAQPARLIKELRRVLGEAALAPPAADDLAKAKARLEASFVFNFASSSAQLQRCLVYELLGLPEDFLFQYRDRVQAVAPDQVAAAARRHLHPAQQVVVVVADAAAARPQLQEAGFVVVDLEPAPAA